MSDTYTSGRYWQEHEPEHDSSAFKVQLAIEALERAGISWPAEVRLADLGCGNGTFLKALCDHLDINQISYYADGFDIAPNAIEFASRKYGSLHLKFHLSDSSSIKATYDIIFVNDVIEHVENPYAFLRNMQGKARLYLVHLPIEVSISHLLVGRPIASYRRFRHVHFFSADSARVLFQEAGFDIKYRFWSVGSKTLNRYPARLPIRLMRWIRFLSYWISPEFTSKVFGGPIMFVMEDRMKITSS